MNRREMTLREKMTGNQRGIALLTVLWVLTVLMVIVFSFSYMARTETLSTLSFKEGMEKRFLAEAGVERGVYELFYRQKMQPSIIKDLVEGGEMWKIDGRPYSGQLGDGNYVVKITDESGKININSAPEVVLRKLIEILGIEGIDIDTVADSIMDWREKGDLRRLNGAKSDYYLSLPNPYKAKNADFDTLEELLLVKGVTRELLYGDGGKRGLIEFLTVQGKTNQINVNAAPKEVLMAFPGMTADMAEEIISYRQKQEIKNIQEIGGSWVNIQALIGLYMPISYGINSNTFTIESSGYREKPQSGYAVRATVTLLTNNQYQILYYKTPVHLKQDEISSQ
ncbi:MAG: helix-hairpin-helix domain-containing protein [Thermodesulfobacteriota bacterium]